MASLLIIALGVELLPSCPSGRTHNQKLYDVEVHEKQEIISVFSVKVVLFTGTMVL